MAETDQRCGSALPHVHQRLSEPARNITVARSLIDPESVVEVVQNAYAVDTLRQGVLVRRFVNDVYLLTGDGASYVFKVYRPEWRDAPAILWEIDLLAHLFEAGAPVAPAVARSDGRAITIVGAPEGERFGVLFSYAAGSKPQPPFTAQLYRRFGRAAGLIHECAQTFTSPYRRRPLDLSTLLDEPLGAIEPLLIHRPEDWANVQSLARKLRASLEPLARAGLDWGPCHHDMSLDNIHVTGDGTITFYDFDSGGPSWRALDFQGVYASSRYNRNNHWDAFPQGYGEFRQLSTGDLAAIPYFVLAYAFWGMRADIIRSRWDGVAFLDDDYLHSRVGTDGWWRRWEAEYL